jgi:hypothetical protein
VLWPAKQRADGVGRKPAAGAALDAVSMPPAQENNGFEAAQGVSGCWHGSRNDLGERDEIASSNQPSM